MRQRTRQRTRQRIKDGRSMSVQPCDGDDAQLVMDAQVYAPPGGGKAYSWQLDVMDANIESPAGAKDVTLHFYDEGGIVDTDQVKCALFVTGIAPNRKIVARGARSRQRWRCSAHKRVRVGSHSHGRPVSKQGAGAGTLAQPFPKFPNEFYTGIDVNIVDRGYSYTIYESYDKSCDAAVQEIFLPTLGHTRYLYDYKNQKLWTMRQGTPEKPKGQCTSRPLDPKDPFVREDGVHLTSAQHYLGLNPNSEYQSRESEGYPTVRCGRACGCVGLMRLLRALLCS